MQRPRPATVAHLTSHHSDTPGYCRSPKARATNRSSAHRGTSTRTTARQRNPGRTRRSLRPARAAGGGVPALRPAGPDPLPALAIGRVPLLSCPDQARRARRDRRRRTGSHQGSGMIGPRRSAMRSGRAPWTAAANPCTGTRHLHPARDSMAAAVAWLARIIADDTREGA